MITITDKGAEKVRDFLGSQGADVATAGLRVGVRGGGCSGFQYNLAFDEQREGDAVFEDHGLKLLVDRTSPQAGARAAARPRRHRGEPLPARAERHARAVHGLARPPRRAQAALPAAADRLVAGPARAGPPARLERPRRRLPARRAAVRA